MMLQIDEYLARIATNVLRRSRNLKNCRFAHGAALYIHLKSTSWKMIVTYISKASRITRKMHGVLQGFARSFPDNDTINDVVI